MRRETMAATRPFDLKEAKATLRDMCVGMSELYDQVTKDHQQHNICRGYHDYQKSMPKTYLDRARERIVREKYAVGFAGGFSAGKSTLINALFGAPDMLPAEAGECTMSITLVSAPPDGGEEHVEVKYFAREDAIRYVIENERYSPIFGDFKDDILGGFTAEKGIAAIKDGIRRVETMDRTQLAQGEPKRELEDFLGALEEHGPQLGGTKMDRIAAAPDYLTTASDGGGFGHLLLIEQVRLYRNNPLFNEQGVHIVDLPGSDSTNPRQAELSYNYLAEADAIMLAVEPRGLSAESKNIWERLARNNYSIRNKMFFLVNKFDTIPVGDLKKSPLEKLLKTQVLNKLQMYNLDPGKLYLTSALRADLENRRDQRIITPEQLEQLNGIIKDCQNKGASLDPDIDPSIRPLVERVYQDGAIPKVREMLVEYLSWDIQVERLKEIYADLKKVYDASDKLLSSEESKLKSIRSRRRTQSSQIAEFFEDAKNQFVDAVAVIPSNVEIAVGSGLEAVKTDLQKTVAGMIDRFPFQRIMMRMRVPNPTDVKMEVIKLLKTQVSVKFAEIVQKRICYMITDKLRDQVKTSRVDQIVEMLATDLGTDHGKRFSHLIELSCGSIEKFTYLRALENTWEIQDADMRPSGYEPKWTPDVEGEFKEDLKAVFVEPMVDAAAGMEQPLARHYREYFYDLVQKMEELIEELRLEIKRDPDRVKLPIDILTGDAEASEEQRIEAALAQYAEKWGAIESQAAAIPADIQTVG
ncbi:dynamin family protein [Planctomycetota bacterium]